MVLLLSVVFSACDEDFNDDVAPPQTYPQETQKTVEGFAVALEDEIKADIVLTQDDIDNEVMYKVARATETPADMSEGSTVGFKFEISNTEDFAKKAEILATSADSVGSIYAGDLNNAVLQVFGQSPKARTFYLKTFIYVQTGTSSVLVPSQVTFADITVTPVPTVLSKDIIYLTGDLITGVNQWANSVDDIGFGLQVLFSDNSDVDNKYTYTAHFSVGYGFKLPIAAGNWDTGYAYSDGKLSPNNVGDNIPTPTTEGYYTLSVDLESLEYSIVPYAEGASAPTYATMGAIGNATPGDWAADTEFIPVANHIWVIPEIELGVGELKFRANNDWADSWGGGDAVELPFGISAYNGSNMAIATAGTYFIAFNDLTGHYIIIEKSKLPVTE